MVEQHVKGLVIMHTLVIHMVTTMALLVSLHMDMPDTEVHTPQATITVQKGAIALICTTDNTTCVYNLYQPHTHMIQVKCLDSNAVITLAPARLVMIGGRKTLFTGINVNSFNNLSNSLAVAKFSIMSALATVSEIKETDEQTQEKIIKSALVLEPLGELRISP